MGDSSRLVSITSSNHHETLVQHLWHFFKTQQGLDFDVQWGGRSVLAHLLVVGVFLSPDKFVPEKDRPASGREDAACLDHLIEFMYCGTVSVPRERLQDLLQVAKDFGFEMLADAVTSAIETGTSSQRRLNCKSTVSAARSDSSNNSQPISNADDSSDNNDDPDSAPPTLFRKQRAGSISTRKRRRGSPDTILADDDDDSAHSSRAGPNQQQNDNREETVTEGERAVGRVRKGTVLATAKNWQECKQCSFKTNDKQAFQVHRAKHDPSILIAHCDACGSNFADTETLPSHPCRERLRHHCSRCSFATHDKERLYLHLATHDSVNAALEVLDHHMDSLRDPPTLPPPTNRSSLGNVESSNLATYQHNVFASYDLDEGPPAKKVKEKRCNLCDFTCTRPSGLQRHIARKHSDVKSLQCPLCSFSCSLKSDLHVHNNRTHLRIRNFPCDFCEKRFSTTSAMERHRRARHTGEKPFICDVCGKAYADTSTLKSHYQCHQTHMEHICHICGHIAKRLRYLKTHLKNVHKMLSPPFGKHWIPNASTLPSTAPAAAVTE